MLQNKTRSLKKILIWSSILGNLLVFLSIGLHWSKVRPVLVEILRSNPYIHKMTQAATHNKTDDIQAQQNRAADEKIERLVTALQSELDKLAPGSKRLDYIRNFVYTKSIHQGGADYAWDTGKVLSMMSEFYETQQNPPHLTCGSRTLAMKAILDRLDIPNRVVMVFSDAFSRIRSHTFLDVFNLETKRWEIQDSDFNLYYEHVDSSVRASTAQLVWGQPEDFVPCSSPSLCGWKEHDFERFLENRRFGAVVYDNRPYLKQQIFNKGPFYDTTVILINTDRFSIDKTFPDNDGVTFLEYASKIYRNPIIIRNQQFE